MSFFKDLKEDLLQAVNELSDETIGDDMESDKDEIEASTAVDVGNKQSNEEVVKEEGLETETNLEFEKMLEEMDSLNETDDPEGEENQEDPPNTVPEVLEDEGEGQTYFKDEDASAESSVIYEKEQEEDVTAYEKKMIVEDVAYREEKNEDETESKIENEVLSKDFEEEEMAADRVDNLTIDENEASITGSTEVTVITKGTTIRGGISSDNSLEVMGTINGDVECQGKLTIIGTVKGNSIASEIFVNTPRLEGDLNSHGSVKIGVGTIVVGDIIGSSAVIAGAVKGNIDVNGPVIIDSTAIVLGNVKAKSLQLNNGAVLEGSCSLGYAEIDLEGFFNSDDTE